MSGFILLNGPYCKTERQLSKIIAKLPDDYSLSGEAYKVGKLTFLSIRIWWPSQNTKLPFDPEPELVGEPTVSTLQRETQQDFQKGQTVEFLREAKVLPKVSPLRSLDT